jgi:predicted metal-dependent HD superfamily phosphohydrolase
LRSLLERRAIYQHDRFYEKYEQQARASIAAEFERLERG